MRHFLSELCILFLCMGIAAGCGSGNGRNDALPTACSGFNGTKVDTPAVRNLDVLCRVWGYAKYHHPAFYGTKGQLDVDAELLRLLPTICNADKRNGTGCSPNGYTALESSRRPPNVMNRTAAKDSGTKLPQRGRPIRQSWAANCPTCYVASGSPTGAGSIAMSNRDSPEAPVRTSPGRTVIRT